MFNGQSGKVSELDNAPCGGVKGDKLHDGLFNRQQLLGRGTSADIEFIDVDLLVIAESDRAY